jgi:hypothetical protein
MHSARKKKKSDAEKSGISGPGPECPGNPETPGKSPNSLGFSTTVNKQISHSFSI